jgi:hypothetical protein
VKAARKAVPRPRCPGDKVDLERHELSAIKSLAATNPAAWSALEKITGVDTMSFAAGGPEADRATCFFEGCRWVGRTLRQIRDMKMPGPPPAERGPHAVPKGTPPAD